jgi:uncharacterized integral membrane protein
MRISVVLSIIVAVLAVVFAVENARPVEVSFLKWSFTGSLALVMILTFIAGMAAAFLASLPGLIRTRLELSKLRKGVSVKEPEKE